ncbi:engulfment and cell motility protein 1 [Nilaparvata lugens]|uniref:engulfment and cell motility protein 1 n=1 Tax=Nilaparvata lugens TaxID=108931 RepID=UPI00193D3E42|nr:engulfment and cell motility protein 1 [Nilaparvata lugens]XP_039284985.1 engulfment and cell motility protein 1 [Nilaparvata lugens]
MLASNEAGVVSVAVQVGNISTLFKFDHGEALQSIIESICKEGGLSFVKNRYALQFIRKQGDPFLAARFVTEENRHNIIDGTELKLVYSAKELGRMILDNLKTNGDLDWALEKLSGHIADPVFASVVQGPCYILVNRLFSEESLPPKLLYYCLKFILGLLKLNYLKEIDETLVKLLADILCNRKNIGVSVIEKTLLILECIAKTQYNQLKESVDFEDLLYYLKSFESSNIKRSALALINALAANCPIPEEKKDMLMIMNTKRFRSTINSSVLFTGYILGNDLKEQLAIYQSLILSLNKELFEKADISLNKLPDLLPIKRYSTLEISAAKGTDNDARRRSAESCTQTIDRANVKWKDNVELLNKRLDFLKVVNNDIWSQPVNTSLSKLVYNCLVYFHKNYNRAYSFILLAEGIDNFIRISDRVANMIAKDILNVGEPPKPNSTTFYLLVFSTFLDDTVEEPALIEELFSQAMLHGERTKREMKVKTLDDYEKVFKITKQKLILALRQTFPESRTFEELQLALSGISYSKASEGILKETESKRNRFYKTSPAISDLKASLRGSLIELIKTQRMQYIKERTQFLDLQEKQSGKQKEKNYLYAQLSQSGYKILYTKDPEINEPDKMSCMFVKHIKSIVTHVKKTVNQSSQNAEVMSTITLTLLPTTNDIKPLNLITQSQEVADYWNDAINCLKGNKMKSDSLRRELKILLDMELEIRLLDLNCIELSIPNEAPPLPPSPPNYDFHLQADDENESHC